MKKMKSVISSTAMTLATTFAITLAASVPGAALAQGTAPAASAAVPRAAPAGNAKILDRAAFDALLAQPERVLVIDVRRPDEIASVGGFPAYLSIQLRELDKYAALIPRERLLVTVSNHAGRAVKAADLLAASGYRVAGAVGAQGYEAEGGSLVRSAPAAQAAPAVAH